MSKMKHSTCTVCTQSLSKSKERCTDIMFPLLHGSSRILFYKEKDGKKISTIDFCEVHEDLVPKTQDIKMNINTIKEDIKWDDVD